MGFGMLMFIIVFSKLFRKKQTANPSMKKTKRSLLKTDLNLENAREFKTNKLQLYIVDDFLNDKQCNLLSKIIKSSLKPSEITIQEKNYRTSYTSDLKSKKYKDFVDYIDLKISQLVQIPMEYSENIQGQHYSVGQEFKTHTDWFNPTLDEYKKNCSVQGNRTWTVMVYLNDVKEGGETYFKDIDHEFKPVKGQAIIWNNLLKDGSVNPNTHHSGKPIIDGEKVIITKWFREYST